jgi:hypothetical protein
MLQRECGRYSHASPAFLRENRRRLLTGAIGIRHPHPSFAMKFPEPLKSRETKKRLMMPVLDDATISAQLSEPNHNSVMKPEVTALCPICNFP